VATSARTLAARSPATEEKPRGHCVPSGGARVRGLPGTPRPSAVARRNPPN
jgi:hypothetical protein